MKTRVLSMNVDVTSLQEAITRVVELSENAKGSYVCLANVHMCMDTLDNPEFRELVNQADLVLPDGKPIAIAQRLLGARDAAQVRGQDVMHEACATSPRLGLKVGLYGGANQTVLDQVVASLQKQVPDIEISFAYCPPFRPLTEQEDETIVEAINMSGVKLLFVGIGCPKQERWMADHKDRVSCVMFGVGAAFDFIAGSKKHAPRWMQYIGLEWFYRLCSEPHRLWRRYLTKNPRFIFHFLRQWLLGKAFE